MDITLIEPDEIEVECLIRGIQLNAPDMMQQLAREIQSENADTKEKPSKMHSNASKRPDLEINACQNKLKFLKESITHLDEVTEDPITLAQQYHSRLLHLSGRLNRVFKSPKHGQLARKVHQACEDLQASLRIYLEDHEKLNESIEVAKGIQLEENIPLPDVQNDEDNKDGGSDSDRLQERMERRTTLEDLLDQAEKDSLARKQSRAQQTTVLESMMEKMELMSQRLAAMEQQKIDALQTQIVVSGNSAETQNSSIVNSQVHVPLNPTCLQASPNFVDRRLLSRSGLTYTGSPSGITIDMFLFQVDTIASSRGLSEQILLFELHTILKDVALQWYWTFRKHNPNASWSELRDGMIERFKDRRTNYEIRRMVEARKQQTTENFVDFYNQVWSLTLQCRTPYSDEELIQILMTNMKPALQYHLTDRQFTSINELIKSCSAWEESFRRIKTPVDPATYSRRTINELSGSPNDDIGLYDSYDDYSQTDLLPNNSVSAMQTGSRVPLTVARRPGGQLPAVNTRSMIYQNSNDASHTVCFNCSDLGHAFIDCPIAPVGLFCYRCGLRDTITPRCRRCAENRAQQYKESENLNRGSWRTGMRESPQQQLPPRQMSQRPNSLRPNQTEAASNTDAELNRQVNAVAKPNPPNQ